MSKLEIGDQVQTAYGYQPIYGFAHKDTDMPVKFQRIYTKEKADPLEVTGEHLIFMAGEPHPVRADTVVPGAVLSTTDSAGASVTKIDFIHRYGKFAPLTLDGTIVVDGIVSSCYVSLQHNSEPNWVLGGKYNTPIAQHLLAHMGLAPVRLACMGISGEFCKSYNADGFSHFVEIGIALSDFINNQPMLLQSMLSIAFLVVFGFIYALECVLGPKLALFALALGLLVTIGKRQRNTSPLQNSTRKGKMD